MTNMGRQWNGQERDRCRFRFGTAGGAETGQIVEKHGEQFFHDGTAFFLCRINTNRIIVYKLYNLQSPFAPIVIVAILLLTWYNVYVQICPPGTGGGAADPLSESGTGTACCRGGRCVGGRPCPLDASYAPSGAAVRCTTKCSLRKDAVSP